MTRLQLPTAAHPARASSASAPTARAARVTNDELAQVMDTSDEWIRTRIGIAERRWAADDETVVEMAVAAGGKASPPAGVATDDIDLVVVASATLRSPIPGSGPQVAAPARHRPSGPFDLDAGLRRLLLRRSALASDAIRAGSPPARRRHRGREADRLSPTSTTAATAIIFADGAGAVGRRPVRRAGHRPGRVGQRRRPAHARIDRSADGAPPAMDGQAVFRWATTKLAPDALEAMRAGRRRRRPTSTCSSRTRRTCASSTSIARKLGAARSRRSSPATSSSPATRPPPPSRWRWTAMIGSRRGRSPAIWRCCSASARA